MTEIVETKYGPVSEYSLNETACTFVQAHYVQGSQPPVIYAHTTGVGVTNFMYPGVFGQYEICHRVAGMGFAVVAGDLGVPDAAAPNDGKNTWGNQVVRDRIRTIRAAGIASGLWANAPGLLIGSSMGGCGALQEYIDHPNDWAGLITCLGVADLLGFYGRLPAFQPLIAGAWGVATGAALPAGANTLARAASIAGKPFIAFYAQDDTTVLPSETEALRTILKGQKVNVGAYGHTEAGLAAASNRPELPTFIRITLNIS